MDGPDSVFYVGCCHNGRNVFLGRTLRNGADSNVPSAYGLEHASAGSGLVFHIVSDKAYYGESAFDFQRLYLIQRYFIGKHFVGGFLCFIGFFLFNSYEHSMYRRSLGDKYDVDILFGKRVKKTTRITRDANHAASFHGKQGYPVTAGDSLDLVIPFRRVLFNESSGSVRIKSILYQDWNSAGHYRLDSGRINDFCPKVRKFQRLFIGYVFYGHSLCNDPGVCGHHAVHIGPYLKDPGLGTHGQ